MFRKGQVEIMGLVVIVLLIVFLGLLFLKFSRPDIDREDEFIGTKANNFLSALKVVTVGNSNFDVVAGECCGGNQGNCDIVESIVESSVNYLDESVNFNLDCVSRGVDVFVDGNCDFGVTSETIILSSGDRISVKLC